MRIALLAITMVALGLGAMVTKGCSASGVASPVPLVERMEERNQLDGP